MYHLLHGHAQSTETTFIFDLWLVNNWIKSFRPCLKERKKRIGMNLALAAAVTLRRKWQHVCKINEIKKRGHG